MPRRAMPADHIVVRIHGLRLRYISYWLFPGEAGLWCGPDGYTALGMHRSGTTATNMLRTWADVCQLRAKPPIFGRRMAEFGRAGDGPKSDTCWANSTYTGQILRPTIHEFRDGLGRFWADFDNMLPNLARSRPTGFNFGPIPDALGSNLISTKVPPEPTSFGPISADGGPNEVPWCREPYLAWAGWLSGSDDDHWPNSTEIGRHRATSGDIEGSMV